MPDHHVKGQPAASTYVREKGCVILHTNRETPCRYVTAVAFKQPMAESELESQIERDLQLQERLRGEAGFDSGDPSRKRRIGDVEEGEAAEPLPP